jgi:phage-related protein
MNNRLGSIKPAIFVGSSRRDLQGFPAAARAVIGQSLFEAQLGDHPNNAKPLKGLSGVLEISDNFDGNAYRAVYTIRFAGILYVLHAFQKKSTKGISTPRQHIDLVKRRLRDAEAIHDAMRNIQR